MSSYGEKYGWIVSLMQFPVWVAISSYIAAPWAVALAGAGNHFGLATLLSSLALFLVDDVGTAIGMQAKEQPRMVYEQNSYLVGGWKQMQRWGVAKTYTSAHRLFMIWFQFWVVFAHVVGMATPFFRVFIVVTAVIKAFSGYRWWFVGPNQYTITDFFSFKPGRITPERDSQDALIEFNDETGLESKREWMARLTGLDLSQLDSDIEGYKKGYRRRLGGKVFSESTIAAIFYLFFPV